ncbi:MAG: tetratricopeptide repeat protein [Acidobacteriota bacterium]
MSNEQGSCFEFGPFRLNAVERMLLRDGQAVPLPPKVFETLVALVENSGRLLAKEELITRLWPDTFVEEGTLARNISDLRKALGETSGGQKYIETVPKAGYRFVAGVQRLSMGEAAVVVRRHTRSRVVVDEEIIAETRRKSLAVMPFKTLGMNEADEYLGLGMADALITRLSNLRQIMVRPTSAVFRYSGKEVDPVSAGRELSVESVLDGTIKRDGDRLSIRVQLVSVKDQSALWASTFDEKFTDIFEVEDRISERIAAALDLELSGSERALIARRQTENVGAYDAYLRGRFFLNKRTAHWIKKAAVQFEEAIRIDPGYAAAHAGLGDTYTHLVTWDAMLPIDGLPKAKAAARRALEIDDTLDEALAGLAHTMLHSWEFDDAERAFKRALELNPSYTSTHLWYSEYLAAMGRFDEAISSIRRGQRLDPLSSVLNTEVGWMYFLARRYDEAVEHLRKASELDPGFWLAHSRLWEVYVQIGEVESANLEFQQTLSLADQTPMVALQTATAYAHSGKRDNALRLLEGLKELWSQRYFSPFRIALIYAALGDADSTFEWLEQGYLMRDARMIFLKVDPGLDPVRDDSRYQNLLQRVGLRE